MGLGALVAITHLFHTLKLGIARFIAIRDGIIVSLLIYAFVITVPTNADRSFTLLMLQRISEAPSHGLSRAEIDSFFTMRFIQMGGIHQRLLEQTTTGTLMKSDSRYVLTSKGNLVNAVSRLTCRLFVCSGRSVQLAAPLVRPSENSPQRTCLDRGLAAAQRY
jgi:hypothetical protein